MAAIGEPETKETRDADIRAILLYPHICPNLAAKLLVHGTWVLGFSELVRHGATKHDFSRVAA
jgi:hypothetical protein